MAQKRATYMTYGDSQRCTEIRKFLEDAGVILDVRDIKKDPLSERELDLVLGHIPVSHFLNEASLTYKKKGLDKLIPERGEMIHMIAEDPTLLRRPIIKTIRLITIGCDKQKIAEMFQINQNGEPLEEPRGNQRRRSTRQAAASSGK